MSAALLEWMETTIRRAQQRFGHANDEWAARKAQWEVDTLESWRQANPDDDAALLSGLIHPPTLRLRRQYEHARQSQEHTMIEWQLERLATWGEEAHAVALAPAHAPVPARTRPRWR